MIGTRPEIIKMSALLPLIDRSFDHLLVHSGQHYSPNMDKVFFEELALRDPDFTLEVGSKTPGLQTSEIMAGVEHLILEHRPDCLVVQGDTNTTLGAALACCKYQDVELVHVEAGTRSGNPRQPEEINRKLIDRVSTIHFVPLPTDLDNLISEGISIDRAVVTGSTIFDSCLRAARLAGGKEVLAKLGLSSGDYALATFHRQETVDDPVRLSSVFSALERLSSNTRLLVPLHPRTRKRIQELGLQPRGANLHLLEPFGYRSLITLLQHARFCLTDSGGLMEEAAILAVPALILRTETEHRSYVESGIHRLVGSDEELIVAEGRTLLEDAAERRRRAGLRPARPEQSPSELIEQTLLERLSED